MFSGRDTCAAHLAVGGRRRGSWTQLVLPRNGSPATLPHGVGMRKQGNAARAPGAVTVCVTRDAWEMTRRWACVPCLCQHASACLLAARPGFVTLN